MSNYLKISWSAPATVGRGDKTGNEAKAHSRFVQILHVLLDSGQVKVTSTGFMHRAKCAWPNCTNQSHRVDPRQIQSFRSRRPTVVHRSCLLACAIQKTRFCVTELCVCECTRRVWRKLQRNPRESKHWTQHVHRMQQIYKDDIQGVRIEGLVWKRFFAWKNWYWWRMRFTSSF